MTYTTGTRWPAALAAVLLCCTGSFALAGCNRCSQSVCGNGNNVVVGAPPASDVGPTASASSVASSPTDGPTDAATGGATGEAPSLPGYVWLSDLQPVSPSSNETTADIAVLDGRSYPKSLVYSCTDFCDSAKSDVIYDLGKHYSRFEAVAGVLDTTPDQKETGEFEVYLDGQPMPPVQVSVGRTQHLSYDVRGVLRIELVAYRPGTVGNPELAGANAAGGVSNNLPHLAWGDPKLST